MGATATNLPVVRQSLELIHPAGQVFEVRILKVPDRYRPCTVAGYFDNIETAVQQIEFYSARQPVGVYTPVN